MRPHPTGTPQTARPAAVNNAQRIVGTHHLTVKTGIFYSTARISSGMAIPRGMHDTVSACRFFSFASSQPV